MFLNYSSCTKARKRWKAKKPQDPSHSQIHAMLTRKRANKTYSFITIVQPLSGSLSSLRDFYTSTFSSASARKELQGGGDERAESSAKR